MSQTSSRPAAFPETFDFGLTIAAHDTDEWILDVPTSMLSTADLRTFISALPRPEGLDARLVAHTLSVLRANVKPRTVNNFKAGEQETLAQWFDVVDEKVPYRS